MPGREIVQYAHRYALIEQQIRGVRSYKTGAAGNQYFFHFIFTGRYCNR